MTDRCRILATTLACLLLTSPAWAVTVTYGDVKITRYSEPQGQATHGYTDYRFLVQHEGKEGTRKVKLSLPGDDDGRLGGRIQEVIRIVQVEPGKSVLVSLLVPAEPGAYGSGVNVWIDDRKQTDRVPLMISTGGRSRHHHGMPMAAGLGSEQLILYSQRVPETFFTPVKPAMHGGMHGGGMGGPGGGGVKVIMPAPGPAGKPLGEKPEEEKPEPGNPAFARAPYTLTGSQVRADSPVSAWSRHWLAFSRYDGIVLTSDDLTELGRGGNETEPILRSLWQYVEAGGVLIVLGKGKFDVPASWRRQSYSRHGATFYSAGFGRCIVTPDADSAKWNHERWSIFDECHKTGQPFNVNRPLQELNRTLAPVDDLGVPVRGLFFMMCLFAVAIGPVNVWMLSRWQRRIWLLWTVPVVSMLTCAAVFGYMVIAEGWQGHARVTGLTVLDETEKRATSIGRTSFYTPLTPSEGLHFEADTELTVVGANSINYRRYGMEESTLGPCTVDWGEGGKQHLARGWVTARVPSHFLLRKSQAEERRVIVAREGESLVLTNALGATIKRIKLADENGDLYEGDEIREGSKAVLRPVRVKWSPTAGDLWMAGFRHDATAPWNGALHATRQKVESLGVKATPEAGALRSQVFVTTDWAAAPKAAFDKSDALLGPRNYLAVVEGSPFLEQAMRGAKERETESVVLGLMADLR